MQAKVVGLHCSISFRPCEQLQTGRHRDPTFPPNVTLHSGSALGCSRGGCELTSYKDIVGGLGFII